MASSESDYQATELLIELQEILAFPRAEYSTDISSLFQDSVAYDQYQDGLIFLFCIVASVLFLWGVVLIVLKLNGQSVGCASGATFLPEYDDLYDNFDEAARHISQQRHASDGYTDAYTTSQCDNIMLLDEQHSFHSSLPSMDVHLPMEGGASVMGESMASSVTVLPSRRERRTQVAFFLTAMVTLACVPLTQIFFFLPLREASRDTSEHVRETRDIVEEVESAMTSIANGVATSLQILDRLPLVEEQVCPLAETVEIERILGFRLKSMIDLYMYDYREVESSLTGNVADVFQIVDYLTEALDAVEVMTDHTATYIWVVPGMLLLTGFLTSIGMFGTFLAWKRDSYQKLQQTLSYIVLPLLVLISIATWMAAAASGIGTALSTDACLAGNSQGSPAVTIEKLLEVHQVDPESFLSRSIHAYSHGCVTDDPSDLLFEHSQEATAIVETIWQYLIAVDTAGRDAIGEMCGEGETIDAFLDGFRDLAKQLMTVSRALDSSSTSLSCPRISSLYHESVNKSLCGDMANALGYGFIILLVAGISTLTLITLRASWRQHIDEDKIYDEDEVAENMIVDEHEEYLLYISKYKHEWEEYVGFEGSLDDQRTHTNGTAESPSGSTRQSNSYHSGFSAEERRFNDEAEVASSPVASSGDEAFDPYTSDSRSLNSADISFLSLVDPRTPQSTSATPSRVTAIPSPLLEDEESGERSVVGEGVATADPSNGAGDSSDSGELPMAMTPERNTPRDIVSSTGKSIELQLPPRKKTWSGDRISSDTITPPDIQNSSVNSDSDRSNTKSRPNRSASPFSQESVGSVTIDGDAAISGIARSSTKFRVARSPSPPPTSEMAAETSESDNSVDGDSGVVARSTTKFRAVRSPSPPSQAPLTVQPTMETTVNTNGTKFRTIRSPSPHSQASVGSVTFEIPPDATSPPSFVYERVDQLYKEKLERPASPPCSTTDETEDPATKTLVLPKELDVGYEI